jgi:hypothetical protein
MRYVATLGEDRQNQQSALGSATTRTPGSGTALALEPRPMPGPPLGPPGPPMPPGKPMPGPAKPPGPALAPPPPISSWVRFGAEWTKVAERYVCGEGGRSIRTQGRERRTNARATTKETSFAEQQAAQTGRITTADAGAGTLASTHTQPTHRALGSHQSSVQGPYTCTERQRVVGQVSGWSVTLSLTRWQAHGHAHTFGTRSAEEAPRFEGACHLRAYTIITRGGGHNNKV